MDSKLYRTHVIIHSYTLAHGATAALLAQSIVGDEVALTYLSTKMIQSISQLYNQPIKKAIGLSTLGHVAGYYIGTRIATSLVKWVPGLGNAANAMSTTLTTELLGWYVYNVVSSGQSLEDIDEGETTLVREAIVTRRANSRIAKGIEETVKSMSQTDKKHFNSLIDELKREDLSEHEREDVENKLDELFRNQGQKYLE